MAQCYGNTWAMLVQVKLILPMVVALLNYKKCILLLMLSRLTIVGCEAKKKLAIRDERVSYLHVALL